MAPRRDRSRGRRAARRPAGHTGQSGPPSATELAAYGGLAAAVAAVVLVVNGRPWWQAAAVVAGAAIVVGVLIFVSSRSAPGTAVGRAADVSENTRRARRRSRR